MNVVLIDVAGLYEPGHRDPGSRRSGYRKGRPGTRQEEYRDVVCGYKSEDDRGRIFVNQIPKADPATPWEALWRRKVQYVELTAQVIPVPATENVPEGLGLLWTWTDAPDRWANPPGERARRAHSQALSILSSSPVRVADNRGRADWPRPNSDPQFEQVSQPSIFTLTPSERPRTCKTAVRRTAEGVYLSKVRLHVSHVGGDNFRVEVRLDPATIHDDGLVTGRSDSTGTMTVWKRIDVEYRKMEHATELPTEDVARVFESAYLQMDFIRLRPPEDQEFLTRDGHQLEDVARQLVRDPQVFENHNKAGWFLVVAARRACPLPERRMLRGGLTGTLGDFERADVSQQIEFAVPNLPGPIQWIALRGGGRTQVFFTTSSQPESVLHLTGPNGLRLRLKPCWFVPEFEPRNGLTSDVPVPGSCYERMTAYLPSHRAAFRGSSIVAESDERGLGFPHNVEAVVGAGSSEAYGISPETDVNSGRYFAGRMIVFTQAPFFRERFDSFTGATAPRTSEETRERMTWVLVHELTHGLGFPHRCGHYTWEEPRRKSCVMNYPDDMNWKFDREDNSARRLDWDSRAEPGLHFCASHLMGIRRVRLEDNPALWTQWPT